MYELDAPIRHRRITSASGNSDLARERVWLEASASGRNDASSYARGGRSCATQEDRPHPAWARVWRNAERRPWTGRRRAARAGRRDERIGPPPHVVGRAGEALEGRQREDARLRRTPGN